MHQLQKNIPCIKGVFKHWIKILPPRKTQVLSFQGFLNKKIFALLIFDSGKRKVADSLININIKIWHVYRR